MPTLFQACQVGRANPARRRQWPAIFPRPELFVDRGRGQLSVQTAGKMAELGNFAGILQQKIILFEFLAFFIFTGHIAKNQHAAGQRSAVS